MNLFFYKELNNLIDKTKGYGMKKMLTTLMITTLFFSKWIGAQKPESVQYISPVHNSIFNSRSSQIIIRPGIDLDASSLVQPDLITVVGSQNGNYAGQIVLSEDRKTVIFKADHLFNPKEIVTVTLNPGLKDFRGNPISPFSFQFTITPLDKTLNPYRVLPDLDPLYSIPDAIKNEIQKTADDPLPSDFPTFEVQTTGDTSAGTIFFSPTHFSSGDGYNVIVDNSGEIQYYKKITTGAPVDFKVLPNGMLAYGVMYEYHSFVGGGPTKFYMMDNTYTVVDSFEMGNGYIADSHEFQWLPNGHALMLAYDLQPVDMSGIVPGGHPGALVAGSVVQELDADKNVVFQWRSWDHYNLTDSYQDLTQSMFDAIHINSIELDHDGNLLISAMALAEITKVSRQTGEIIWRMGGKNNEFTFINESQENAPIYFMWQHDVRRIDNGNITVFDDGDPELRPYTRVVEYQIDETGKTATNVWEYRHSPDIYTSVMGNAQRLPNGNTLIGWGIASMLGKTAVTEVDPAGNVVFELAFNKLLFTSYRAFRFNWNGGLPAAEVTKESLHAGDPYEFSNYSGTTGVTLEFNSMGGFGYNEATISQYNYGPIQPLFFGKPPTVLPFKITAESFNIYNYHVDVLFDADFFNFQYPDSILVYYREFAGNTFIPLPTEYNHVTRNVKATVSRQGSFQGEFVFTQQDLKSMTFSPLLVSPADSGKVDQTRPVRLEWTPVGYVNSYDLQISTDPQFSNIIVNETGRKSAVYDLVSPAQNATYYWRVKSSNDAGQSEWSNPQMFQTTAPYITIMVPNGGESWQRGLKYFIQWDDIIEDDVIIELYQNDSYLMLIDTVSNTGGYRWDIPVGLGLNSNYKISIKSSENPAVSDMSDLSFSIIDTVSAVDESQIKNMDFGLSQNYPNPFNSETRITYTIPKRSHVSLKIYNLLGKEVALLVDENQSPDRYTVHFDASKLTTGIYFYKLVTGENQIKTRKMVIIK